VCLRGIKRRRARATRRAVALVRIEAVVTRQLGVTL